MIEIKQKDEDVSQLKLTLEHTELELEELTKKNRQSGEEKL